MALTNATAVAADGDAIQIDASNNVGIGVSPSYKLHVSGAIYATADVTAFSSAAAKDDIVTIADPLDLIGKLRGVSWTWKDSGEKSQGVIYEELAAVLPELTSAEGGAKGVKYQNLVGLLIESVKALKAEIDELRGQR